MNRLTKFLACAMTVVVGSPMANAADQNPQIAEIARAHVDEIALQGPFIMIPEAVEAVKRKHTNLQVSDNDLFKALHDAAVAKGGMLIGLEWND